MWIYKMYFGLKRIQKKSSEKGKKQNVNIQKMIDRIEWFYNIPVYQWYMKHPSKRKGVTQEKRKQEVIISLTSYPKRIDTIWMTIETLMRQSVKADRIILWLAESQFQGVESLPQRLLQLRERGLEIRFIEDIRSHKKYFYVMQEYPNDLIVLVDDDMFYPKDMLKQLLKLHSKYPQDICTMTAQKMTPSFEAKPSIWRNPLLNERLEHCNDIQIFTGSGSLYPPGSINKSAFDKELIKELCLYADDLWLTFMAYKNKTKITALFPWRAFPITIYGTAAGSLWYINSEDGKNDEQWDKIINYFKGEL